MEGVVGPDLGDRPVDADLGVVDAFVPDLPRRRADDRRAELRQRGERDAGWRAGPFADADESGRGVGRGEKGTVSRVRIASKTFCTVASTAARSVPGCASVLEEGMISASAMQNSASRR
jgi:hypothetical protein